MKFYFELLPRRVKTKINQKIFKFFDYAPRVYFEIRKIFNITTESYLESIGP